MSPSGHPRRQRQDGTAPFDTVDVDIIDSLDRPVIYDTLDVDVIDTLRVVFVLKDGAVYEFMQNSGNQDWFQEWKALIDSKN